MPLKTAISREMVPVEDPVTVSRETVIQVDICPPAMLVNYDCNSVSVGHLS